MNAGGRRAFSISMRCIAYLGRGCRDGLPDMCVGAQGEAGRSKGEEEEEVGEVASFLVSFFFRQKTSVAHHLRVGTARECFRCGWLPFP